MKSITFAPWQRKLSQDILQNKQFKLLLVFSHMRFSGFLYLFAFCMITYSQDRICFIDSLDYCKDEIEKLERFNYKKLRKFPAYRKYSNLKQLHFFWVKSKTYCPITNEEFLDYSFLRQLQFFRVRRKTSMFRSKLFLNADTFLFTPEGKLVGRISFGFVEDPNWMKNYNADDLGRLVAENKISFAFCGGRRTSFCHGTGDMYCVVINGEIFLVNNLVRMALDNPDDPNFRLIPFEEFINQKE